jgi:hypothetical protein
MTRLLFAGKHTCPDNCADRPFTLSLTDKMIRFNDYDNDHLVLVHAVPMLSIFTPTYRTGHSNDQQPYELLDWTASKAWHEPSTDQWHFPRLNIQTWDRETFFLWARWPHRRNNSRFWPIEHSAEQVIFTLDVASRARLLRFMDSIKGQMEARHD